MQVAQQSAEQFIEQATALLHDRYQRLLRAGANELTPGLAIKPGLDAKEAEYFLLGIERGIFSIDDESYVQSTVLPPPSKKGTQKRILQLFWRRQGRRYVFREGVCQLATVAELVLGHQWPIERIQMEPRSPEFPNLAWAVDIILRGAGGTIVAGCEVKRNDRELDRLLKGFDYCCTRGSHSKAECEFKINHAKFEFCATKRPGWFMAVSPGKQVLLRLSYDNGGVTIGEQIGPLPEPKWGRILADVAPVPA
jgi:hypothetical protein